MVCPAFTPKKGATSHTKSDHHVVILTLDLTTPALKPSRTSHYTFKDKEGQMMFYNVTDSFNKLTEALSTKGTFEFQVSNWEKQMKKLMFQSFPKIRNRKRKFKKDEVGFLLERRKKLRENPPTVETEIEITKVELEIVANIEQKYADIVNDTLGGITGEDGKINANGLWKQTRKIFPKNKDPIPIAFEDSKGNVVTNYNAISKLALDEISKILRKRPMHPNLKSLEKAKIRLANIRLKIA